MSTRHKRLEKYKSLIKVRPDPSTFRRFAPQACDPKLFARFRYDFLLQYSKQVF